MSEEPQAPKRRNWLVRIVRSRDFTRDIIVTTLGVLIALGIGAIVDAVAWRMRLAASERMMRQELSVFRGVMAYNLLTLHCVRDKTGAVLEILETSRSSGRLPRIEGIGFPRDFGAFGDSWALAQSSDVMLHMRPETAMGHASRWVNVRYVSGLSTDAQTAWQQLAVLEDRPGPISIDTIDTVMKDLTTAAYSASMAAGIGGREDQRLAEEGLHRLMPNGQPWNLAEMRSWVKDAPMCIPLTVDGRAYRPKKPSDPVDLPKDLVG